MPIRTLNPWGHVSRANRAWRAGIARDIVQAGKKDLPKEESTVLQRITHFGMRPQLVAIVRIMLAYTYARPSRDPSPEKAKQIYALCEEMHAHGIWNDDIDFVLIYDIDLLRKEAKGRGSSK